MNARSLLPMLLIAAGAALAAATAAAPVALAQPADQAADQPQDPSAAGASPGSAATATDAATLARDDEPPPPPPPKPKRQLAVGAKLRYLAIPRGLVELFVERVPEGTNNVGFTAELAWRKNNKEVSIGVGYDTLSAPEGLYLEKDKSIQGRDVDAVRNDSLGWITAEINWTGLRPFSGDLLAFRYGGGVGVGILTGKVRRTDQLCTTNSYDSCAQDPAATNIDEPYDLKSPVYPVINGYVGLQIKPDKNFAINIDGGIRFVLPTLSIGLQMNL